MTKEKLAFSIVFFVANWLDKFVIDAYFAIAYVTGRHESLSFSFDLLTFAVRLQ
jgi:hypothetical protein